MKAAGVVIKSLPLLLPLLISNFYYKCPTSIFLFHGSGTRDVINFGEYAKLSHY